MLARLQQVTTIGLVLAAIAWAAYFVRIGAPAWAAAGALLVLFGYAVFLGVEFVLLRWVFARELAVEPAHDGTHEDAPVPVFVL